MSRQSSSHFNTQAHSAPHRASESVGILKMMVYKHQWQLLIGHHKKCINLVCKILKLSSTDRPIGDVKFTFYRYLEIQSSAIVLQ